MSICLEGPDLPQTGSLAGMMIRMELALPDDIDPELWFPCGDVAGARDYLYPSVWHTAPGRMGAYCAAKDVYFRASAEEVPADAPIATRYWVRGYLAGSLPSPPYDDPSEEELGAWRARAHAYFASGSWPSAPEEVPD